MGKNKSLWCLLLLFPSKDVLCLFPNVLPEIPQRSTLWVEQIKLLDLHDTLTQRFPEAYHQKPKRTAVFRNHTRGKTTLPSHKLPWINPHQICPIPRSITSKPQSSQTSPTMLSSPKPLGILINKSHHRCPLMCFFFNCVISYCSITCQQCASNHFLNNFTTPPPPL